MQYPVSDAAHWRSYGKMSLREKIELAIRNRRYRRRAIPRASIELHRVHGNAAPAADGIVLLCVLRNGLATLPSFLRHYREMGVQRFAFVDDASDDGTPDYLKQQFDVDLYVSNFTYRSAEGGLAWRDMLVEIYGRDRWYVSIDSDEYLVYPGIEKRPVQSFISDLERHQLGRALAPMLDIYPDGPLGSIEAPVGDESPVASCPLYDETGYTAQDEKFCTSIRGGPRHRVFGTPMRMTKFPVIYVDRPTGFGGGSPHGPLPLQRNFAAPTAVLLHHKFAPGSVETFRSIAARGSHFDGSAFYKTIIASGEFGPHTDFRYEGSRRYGGSEALVEQGFIQDLRASSS